jgi:Outer membrane protein beta-barrel domain
MSRLLRPFLITAVLLPAVGAAQQTERPTPTQSNPFNYTYVELGYAETEFDIAGAGDLDGDGFTLSGSYEINEDWHAFAGYGNADLDFGIDLDTWLIGAGYRYPLREDTDVYGRLMFVNLEADVPGPGDPDDDGLGIQARIRHWINDDLEVEGGIQYLNVSDSDVSLQAEGRYYFQDNFSVGLGLSFGGDNDGIGVSARLSF